VLRCRSQCRIPNAGRIRRFAAQGQGSTRREAKRSEGVPIDATREELRDWHRLFGLLLTDYFTGLPFTVEVERDLSQQQQFLDVVIVRRRRRKIVLRLPDGLDDLRDHNLISFKSHREALDAWAIRELLGHYVAYRKLVSPTPSDLLPEERFGLYAVCARFPHNLAGQVPWQQVQAGVYDCHWGLDSVRVIVAGELPREAHNAPLHLFSASPELVGFASGAYRRRSENTSGLLGQLFQRFEGEGIHMAFTMEDFRRQFVKEHFAELTTEEQAEVLRAVPPEVKEEVLQSLPADRRLAGLSEEEIRQYLESLQAGHSSTPRRSRRKK
jgi:hypothetical protein